jgi:serine-type D-Ala-D-Ala carboxypeptidase/endopeptidase (penicillin-binding protein 4)
VGISILLAAFWLARAAEGAAAQGAQLAPGTEAEFIAHVQGSIRRAALGDRIGIAIVDLPSGRKLVAHNANLSLKPASNMKLVTAAACLLELGGEFRIPTALYGELKGGSITGGLYLKGYGDPTLQSQDLFALASQLASRGVKRVDELVIDGSRFDERILPPGFEEQPREFSAFRAAVAAVSVDENAYTLMVAPGSASGASAIVSAKPADHFIVQSSVTTSARGALQVVLDQKQRGDKLAVALSGSLPAGTLPVAYRRRVESPLHYAGAVMVEALRAAHIEVPTSARLAAMPPGKPLLVSHQSPPLAQMLAAVGKYSDNFVAEMLLKVLGAERAGPPAHSQQGADIALGALAKLGIPTADVRMVNGSGLFGDSRIAPAQFAELLARLHASPAVAPEFIAQLAVAGVDGTLTQRLTGLASARVVRAKTGTLDDVIALSGYVLGRTPDRALAFSILLNGVRGKQAAARDLADDVVRQSVDFLWRAVPAEAAARAMGPAGP